MKFILAIDGPAASGKSTVSKYIASKIGFDYLDTGSMYRAHTLFCLNNNIDVYNEELINSTLNKCIISFKGREIFLNNVNVTDKIRNKEVTNLVSITCAYKKVREYMVSMQREIAKNSDNGVVLDGRDIGSVVFPNANLKIYLTASIEKRAIRRKYDFDKLGINMSIEDISKDLIRRDKIDSSRENSPLIICSDAIIIDNSNISLEETADKIISLIKEKLDA